jgi:hypothetical protein
MTMNKVPLIKTPNGEDMAANAGRTRGQALPARKTSPSDASAAFVANMEDVLEV